MREFAAERVLVAGIGGAGKGRSRLVTAIGSAHAEDRTVRLTNPQAIQTWLDEGDC